MTLDDVVTMLLAEAILRRVSAAEWDVWIVAHRARAETRRCAQLAGWVYR